MAQAIHDDPSIKSNVRIYSIGSWNTLQDSAAREYLFNNHSDLWWIESDTTFRCMYMGGAQGGEWGNNSFVQQNVKGHGAIGELFFKKKRDIKMGDTPSLLHLLRGNTDDPTTQHWGGAFVPTDHGKQFWTDNPDLSLSINKRAGAKTVSDWRRDYLEDWKLLETTSKIAPLGYSQESLQSLRSAFTAGSDDTFPTHRECTVESNS